MIKMIETARDIDEEIMEQYGLCVWDIYFYGFLIEEELREQGVVEYEIRIKLNNGKIVPIADKHTMDITDPSPASLDHIRDAMQLAKQGSRSTLLRVYFSDGTSMESKISAPTRRDCDNGGMARPLPTRTGVLRKSLTPKIL